MELLKVKDLTFTYAPYLEKPNKEEKPVLEQVSFCIADGSFTVLCGENGCGKSTLLRLIKQEIAPAGTCTGEILLAGTPLSALTEREKAYRIGYVAQNPEHSLVTDKVWHELAFGLENLGVENMEIRRRVAEIAAYFGMEEWYDRRIEELSGGQKQILSLASVLVMQPQILLLDEPISQLDPIATQEFLRVLQKCNQELGITVFMVEHRLEEVFSCIDQLLVLEKGQIMYAGIPEKAELSETMWKRMPCQMQLKHALAKMKTQGIETEINEKTLHVLLNTFLKNKSLAIAETREFISCLQQEKNNKTHVILKKEANASEASVILDWKQICFSYDGKKDVLRDFSISLRTGEIYCLLGGNGSGKTTALKILAGLLPMPGIRKKQKDLQKQIAYLPQNVECCFLHDSVREEIGDGNWLLSYDFGPLLAKHPYDLSGGEKQLVALEKVLRGQKQILLLDEPAKGLDAYGQEVLLCELQALKEKGYAILVVTHEVEFAAACGDRIGLFFRGEIVATDTLRKFLQKNTIYTTQAARIARDLIEDVVTTEELIETVEEMIRNEG